MVVTGENTVASVNDACNEIAVGIGISHALTVDDSLRRRTEVVPYLIEHVLQFAHFFGRKRCSGIAVNTAFAFASFQIAAEKFRQNVGRKYNIAHLDNGRQGRMSRHKEKNDAGPPYQTIGSLP